MLLGNQNNKLLVLFLHPSFKMTTPYLPPGGRGISPNLSTCRESRCNNHGNCVTPTGGGRDLVCDCFLGYKGDSCEETVNGALGLPLTLSVLAILIGLAILAFIVAKYQRRKQKQRRKLLEQKPNNNAA